MHAFTSPLAAAKLLALLALMAPTDVLAQSTGKFSFLTMNVAGLPSILNPNEGGDKTANAKAIGSVFAAQNYDIIHVQEDFNYHASIYETDNHPVRSPTSGGVPFGSGLNTLANYQYNTLNRIKWDKCNLNSGDCLTPKGFTFMRMQVADGVELDLYNLHADAGGDNGDFTARASNYDQVLSYIGKNSVGRAVIVAGDTNDRYTNAQRSIDKFASAGFTDSWVKLVKNGVYPTAGAAADACSVPAASNSCEIVDKILYRSGDSVKLDANTFNYDSSNFKNADGSNLSDHNPVRVDFTYTKA